jgi:hypothetical protein
MKSSHAIFQPAVEGDEKPVGVAAFVTVTIDDQEISLSVQNGSDIMLNVEDGRICVAISRCSPDLGIYADIDDGHYVECDLVPRTAGITMKSVLIANERTDGTQAMYVDGILRAVDDTIHVKEIIKFVRTDTMTLTQEDFDLPEFGDWPDTLEALRAIQQQISENPPSE